MSQTYNAFISYRHCDLDKVVAESVHLLLEEYKLPSRLLKKYKYDKLRIFRDREELSSSGNLADNISTALAVSEYLIIICSKDTPESQWVAKEVEEFIHRGSGENIIIVLVSGSIEESCPAPLLEYIKDNRRKNTIIDIRSDKSLDKSYRKYRKKRRILDCINQLNIEKHCIFTKLIGVEYTEFMEVLEKNYLRKKIGINIIIAIFFVVIGFYGIYNFKQILKAKDIVTKQRTIQIAENKKIVEQKNKAMWIINQLTYDIPQKLQQYPKANRILMGVLQDNITLLDKIMTLQPEDKYIYDEKAANLVFLGDKYSIAGDKDNARKSYENSIAYFNKAVSENNSLNVKYGVAASNERLGNFYYNTGDYSKAQKYLENSNIEYNEIADKTKLENDLAAFANNNMNYGNSLYQKNDIEKALSYYKKGNVVYLELFNKSHENSKYIIGLATSYINMANSFSILFNNEEAINNYTEAYKIYNKLSEGKLKNRYLFNDCEAVFSNLINIIDVEKAAMWYKRGEAIIEEQKLYKNDGDIAVNIAKFYEDRSMMLIYQGNINAAAAMLSEACNMHKIVLSKTKGNEAKQEQYFITFDNILKLILENNEKAAFAICGTNTELTYKNSTFIEQLLTVGAHLRYSGLYNSTNLIYDILNECKDLNFNDSIYAYKFLLQNMDMYKGIRGFDIMNIQPEGSAAKAGLKKEDIIISLNGIRFSSYYSMRFFLKTLKNPEKIKIEFLRKNNHGEYIKKTTDVEVENNLLGIYFVTI